MSSTDTVSPDVAAALEQVRMDPATLRGCEGFHRVGKAEDGRWWLIDPQGKPWIYKGVCGLNRAGTQGGRLAKPGPYHDVIGQRFGEDPQPFVDDCLRILRELGFNAAGGWVTEPFFDQGLVYTDILECVKLDDATTLRIPGVRLPDVFDPAWAAAVDAQAAKLCTPRRNSTQLLGYFTDNEMGWGQADADHIWGASDEVNAGRGKPTLLQVCLTQPPTRPVHQAAWDFVCQQHRTHDIPTIAKRWGITLTDEADLTRQTDAGLVMDNEAYGRDQDAFSRHFARRYFQITTEAIRRHDPNHLILGCRFGAPPGPNVLQAMPDFVDIISANNYRHTMYERMDDYARHVDLPVLNGEFSWASDYFSRIPIEGEPAEVRDDPTLGIGELRRVHVKAIESLERAITHPAMVGYTWYRWVQRNEDQDRFHYGIVNTQHDLNRFNAALFKAIHPRLEALALGLTDPRPVPAATA